MTSLEAQLEIFVGGFVGIDPAHDLLHVKRVVRNAQAIANEEKAANRNVVLAAAWLHDVLRYDGDGDIRGPSSVQSAAIATEFLSGEGLFSEPEIDAVHHAIAAHSFSAGITPETLEARIIRDADRLDALGAIGIARSMIVGGRFGASLYNEVELVPAEREIDDRRFIVDHFYSRLFQLEQTFLTDFGKREAARRTEYMRCYISELTFELS